MQVTMKYMQKYNRTIFCKPQQNTTNANHLPISWVVLYCVYLLCMPLLLQRLISKTPTRCRKTVSDMLHRYHVSFYWHWSTLTSVGISNYIHYNVCNKITYPFPNFNGCTVEVWEWISNFTPNLAGIDLLILVGITMQSSKFGKGLVISQHTL